MARRRQPKRRRRRPKPPRHARPARPAARAANRPAARPDVRGAARKKVAHTRDKHAPRRSPYRAAAAAARTDIDALGAALAAETDVARGLDRLLTAARRLTGAEAGTVYLRRGETLEFAAIQNDVLARQLGEEEVRRRVAGGPLPLRENSIAGYVMLTRTTVNLRDASEIPMDRAYMLLRELDRKADYRTRSMLALPLRDARERVVGVLQLINALDRRGAVRPFTSRDQQLAHELVAQAARLPGLAPG